MLIDLDDEEIKMILSALSISIYDGPCPIKQGEDLCRKLNYFLEEYTGIEND